MQSETERENLRIGLEIASLVYEIPQALPAQALADEGFVKGE